MSTTDDKAAQIQLLTPVQYLPGVGPQRAARYEKLGIRCAQDLLFQFPRDYQDMSQMCTADDLVEGELASLVGTIDEIDLRETRNDGTILAMLVRADDDFVRLLWFNQPFVKDRFKESNRVLVSGKPKKQGMRWEFVHPQMRLLGDDEDASGQILPVYPLTEGLKQADVRRAAKPVALALADELEDVLPIYFREANNLCSIGDAIRQIHLPADQNELQSARRRFVFQELLVLQLALAMRRTQQLSRGSVALPCDARVDARIRRLFSFPLTAGQEKVITEITTDMGRQVPMNRLLQGDVGSGKTLVAIYAMLVAVVGKCQAVLMAPTEVLARQHFDSLSKVLAAAQVRVRLLSGSLSAAERRDTLAAVKAGEVDLVVGTQALSTPS